MRVVSFTRTQHNVSGKGSKPAGPLDPEFSARPCGHHWVTWDFILVQNVENNMSNTVLRCIETHYFEKL